jgi:predicted fused transcriptional regulator/phosphomethylpyrimidine kinase
MANFTFSSGTATIGVTEFSVAQNANYSSGSPRTTLGYVQTVLDFSAMTAAETYRIKIYEKVNGGTQRLLTDPVTLVGVQGQLYTLPLVLLGDGWDVTVQKIAGTDRSIRFSVRQDTNDVNTATITAGAIAAATFATDAIDANAVAASAGTEIRTGLATATALALVQTDTTTLTTRVDVVLSTRAPSSTAVSNVDYTSGRAANLDAAISTRAPSATALSNVQWTNARAALLDGLDVAVSTRAPAATAISNVDYTSARAANLDAAISTRAPSTTALSTAQWTNDRAALVDNLDAAVSSRASSAALTTVSGNVSAVGAAVLVVNADTDDIQARLPAALDGSGNIKAGVQTMAAGAITAIAAGVLAAAVEGTITVQGALRLIMSSAVFKVSGFLANVLNYRDAADTKNRIIATTTTDGRTTVTVDPT